MARIARTPRLLAAFLIARNRGKHATRGNLMVVMAGAGALLLLIWLAVAIGPALDWLEARRLASAAVCAVVGAMLVARHRVLKRAQFARSWLAAVPIHRAVARWEAVMIETLPGTVLIAAFALVCAPHWRLWACLSAGIAIGSLASYAIPAPKPLDLPPGSRYVPHKKAKGAPTVRPSLKALGLWPLRQMFAWAQPKMVARATIPIFLAMPLGTMADTAMVVVGFSAASGALFLLVSAAISAGAKARRWTTPLPLQVGILLRFFLVPTLCAIAGLVGVSYLLLLLLKQ